MIESRYWKEDLLKHAKRLRPLKKPPRWSEKLLVNFEKDIIISFFSIRELFDSHKVSSKSKEYQAEVFSYAAKSEEITRFNQWDIDEVYDLDNEIKVKKPIRFLANQLIHSVTIFAYRNKDRNWGGVYACSDHERNNTIYRIPISEIISILNIVGNDYPSSVTMLWNEEIGDYDIVTGGRNVSRVTRI